MKKLFTLYILIFLIFIITDKVIEKTLNPYLLSSGQVNLNCYEIVRRDHPEKVWDKIFYGNSIIISGYREEESKSGYINAGLDCGLMTDLWKMIKTNEIKIGSELVIAFNSSLSFYDNFMTEPTNPWFRKWYQPYCYFQRNKLKQLIKNIVLTYIFKDKKMNKPFKNQQRELYYGVMSKKALKDKLASQRMQKYYEMKYSDLENNIIALEKITNYCKNNNIRLRFVWIPPNPTVEQLDLSKKIYNFLKDYTKKNEIEMLDLSNKFDKECYYDQNHFNYEYGSHVFMEVIEPWLSLPK